MSSPVSPPVDASSVPHDFRARFERLVTEWKTHSRHMSNSAQMAMLPAYQRIIGMGLPAVPLILEELRRDPDQWFWALEAITEANPVPPESQGKVREMATAWIEWGERNYKLSRISRHA